MEPQLEEALRRAHAEGNRLYQQGLFGRAVEAWTAGIDGCCSTTTSSSSSSSQPLDGPLPTSSSSTAAAAASALLAKSLANRAQAWLQLREPARAERDCAAALRLDPGNAKVLLRRATALLELERVEEALAALDRALALAPPPSLMKPLLALRGQARAMSSMLRGPGGVDADASEAAGLVDEAQTLRLSFKDGPPAALPLNAWATISLFLANEFGLWRRTDFPTVSAEAARLPVHFTVYDHGGDYLTPSRQVGVEVEEVREGEEGDGKPAPPVTLQRGSACRVRARLRFVLLDDGGGEMPAAVHVMAALPERDLARAVLPVVSLPVRLLLAGPDSAPSHHDEDDSGGIDGRLGIVSCRAIELPALRRRVLIAESPGQAGIAGKIWDAGLVLTKYMAAHPEALAPPRRCIELGAGTGVAGIAAALLGADVVITDLEDVVPLIQRNIDLNISSSSSSPMTTTTAAATAGGGRATARPYAWGGDRGPLGSPTFDVILMADVVYDPKYYSALVRALRDLSHEETVVVFAHRERHPDCALFFAEAREYFEMAKVPFALVDGGEDEGEEEGEARGTKKACSDVEILEMRPKQQTAS